jgi:hypothetical protein
MILAPGDEGQVRTIAPYLGVGLSDPGVGCAKQGAHQPVVGGIDLAQRSACTTRRYAGSGPPAVRS